MTASPLAPFFSGRAGSSSQPPPVTISSYMLIAPCMAKEELALSIGCWFWPATISVWVARLSAAAFFAGLTLAGAGVVSEPV